MSSALRFYFVVAVSGAVVMALEILSIRILSPAFGNSVYVWGSIISVFLASLALGYRLGGGLADRHPTLVPLGRLLILAGAFVALLLVAGTRLTGWLGELTGHTPAGTLVAAALLFGPPTVLLATVSPFAIRLAAKDLSHLGNVAGRLYALSTAGSLVGTLIATFVLIPFLDQRQILGLLLVITAATGITALIGSLRSERAALAAAVTLGLLALFAQRLPEPSRPGGLVKRITPYQTLEIAEVDDVRFLYSDGFQQTGVRLGTGEPGLVYPRFAPAALLLRPEIRSLLVLGLGGGSTGRYLQKRIPGLDIDYVEIDPTVVELAREYLLFEPAPTDRVHMIDARRFLSQTESRWDMIYADTYIGLAIPFHLTTLEFFGIARERLEPDGVFAVNLAAGLTQPFSRAVYATLSASFRHTYVFSVPRTSNILIVATDAPSRVTREAALRRAELLETSLRFDPSLTVIAKSLLDVELELGPEDLLSDSFAPVDRLVHLGERGAKD